MGKNSNSRKFLFKNPTSLCQLLEWMKKKSAEFERNNDLQPKNEPIVKYT